MQPDRYVQSEHLRSEDGKWVGSYNLDADHKLTIQRLRAQAVQFETQGNAYIGFIQGGGFARWEKKTQKVTMYVLPPTHGRTGS